MVIGTICTRIYILKSTFEPLVDCFNVDPVLKTEKSTQNTTEAGFNLLPTSRTPFLSGLD